MRREEMYRAVLGWKRGEERETSAAMLAEAWEISQPGISMREMNCGNLTMTELSIAMMHARVTEDMGAENPYEAEVANYDTGEAGYLDFKERLYAINPKSGEMKRIEVENPICLTRGEKEILVYAYQQGEYRLISYDTINDKFSVVKVMNNLGYLFAMVYRDNCLYYTGSQYPGLWKCDMTTGETSCLNEEAVIVKDADLYIINKSLYMLDHLGGKIYQY